MSNVQPTQVVADSVSISAANVTVNQTPPPVIDKSVYGVNVFLLTALLALGTSWTHAHIQQWAAKALIGGATILALSKMFATLARKLVADDGAQKALLAKRSTTSYLASALLLFCLAALFVKSLHVRLGRTDATRVTVATLRNDERTFGVNVSERDGTAGTPFIDWPWQTRYTLVVERPRGYHPQTIDFSALVARTVEFPRDFQRIPIVRVIPGRSIVTRLPKLEDPRLQTVRFHVCTGKDHWRYDGYKYRPVYFGSTDRGVVADVAQRGLNDAFYAALTDYVVSKNAKGDDITKQVAQLRSIGFQPLTDRDLRLGEVITIGIDRENIQGKSDGVACGQTRLAAHLTTIYMEAGGCEQQFWQQCLALPSRELK